MKHLASCIQRLLKEEDGAAAAEYAILVAFVGAAVAAAVSLFDLGGIYTTVSTKVSTLVNSAK